MQRSVTSHNICSGDTIFNMTIKSLLRLYALIFCCSLLMLTQVPIIPAFEIWYLMRGFAICVDCIPFPIMVSSLAFPLPRRTCRPGTSGRIEGRSESRQSGLTDLNKRDPNLEH